jgi:tRNA nucleotidyltransferase (CCA-adding enzyme)
MKQPKLHNIAGLLKKRTTPYIFNMIKTIGIYADEYKVQAYLVGGIVRDLFLDTRDADIDITVEGDGMKFAKYLADNLGAAYKGFDRFKTGKVFMKDGMRIDVASARAELYPQPAALPEVEFTELDRDLYRRDFTINSMAMKVNHDEFGFFIDPFDGIGDLKRRVLKCIHKKSFIDDPTRIIRAVRFETRLGYKIEKRTMSLLKDAVSHNAFEPAPGERLLDELLILLGEKDPYKAVKRLETIGALQKICPGVRMAPAARQIFRKLSAMRKYGAQMELLYFMAVVKGVSENNIRLICKRLKLSNEWRKLILQARHAETKLKRMSKKKMASSEIYDIMTGLNPEAMLYMMAITGDKHIIRNVMHYMNELMHAVIEINGNDLKAMGLNEGPAYSEILRKVTMAKLDGRVNGKKEEVEFARQLIMNDY